MLPDLERAERIGEFWGYPQSPALAELLIDCEEDRTLRAVLVGMLRETDRGGGRSPLGSVRNSVSDNVGCVHIRKLVDHLASAAARSR
jgi:hypothetical protein